MSRDRLSARLSLYVATASALCLLTICDAQLDNLFKLVQRPLSTRLVNVKEGDVIVMTCEIEKTELCLLSSSCNPVIDFYRADADDTYLPVTDSFWKVTYQRTCIRNSEKSLACSLIIPFYFKEYHGGYSCVWWDSNDRTINDNVTYTLGSGPPPSEEQEDQLKSPLTCVLPEVENILAVPSFTKDEAGGTVMLTWDVTVREDDNLDPCEGGKNWRVRVSACDDSNHIPNDFSKEEEPFCSGWENVHGEDTSHTFNFTFTNDLYYLFEVGHRTDRLNQSNADKHAEIFPSHVFYFGQQVGARIDQSNSDGVTTLTAGQSTEIKCVATGIPPPYVFFTTGTFEVNGSVATLLLNDATESDTGTYVCYASNDMVNPPTGKILSTDAVRFRVNIEAKNSDPEGVNCEFLQEYSGHCKDFLHPDLMYYTNYSTASTRESVVGGIMTKIDEIIEVVDKRCRSLAYAMVCNSIYPPCNPVTGINSPRAICPSACEVFTSGECAGLIGPEDEDVYPYISQCDQSGNRGGELPECVPISPDAPRIDEFETIEDTGSCVRGNGRGFSGLLTVTRSGISCDSWGMPSTQEHPMLPDIFRADLKKPNSQHSCRNPGGIGEGPWCYTVNSDIRWEYCDIPKCDSCKYYQGSVCRSLPGYTSQQVLVRKGKTISGQDELEREMNLLINSIKYHHKLTKGCEDFLVMALCHSTFPFCQSGSEDQALKLCSDHCQLLENLATFCPDAHKEYEKYVTSYAALVSSAECDLVTDTNSLCLSLPPPQGSVPSSSQNSTVNCYSDTDQGRNYRGTASRTLSGVTCLAWDSDEPREDFITAENYPELDGAENYCRNPGGLLTAPWCYVSSGTKVVDFCDIPVCQQGQSVIPDGVVGDETEEVPSAGTLVTALLGVFLGIVIILLVGVVIVAVGMLHFRHKSNKKHRQPMPFRVTNIISEEKYCSNPDYTMQVSSAPSAPNEVIVPEGFRRIDKEKITYVSQLGQGNFGVVFKGKAMGVVDGKSEIEVAVKTLKQEAAAEMVSSFMEEAKLMFSFDHPNILSIYGVCMDEFPYHMVFEYMDEGDLTQFLRSRASSTQRRMLFPFSYHSRTESNLSNDPPSLSKTQLLYISEQIASGMAYLAAKNHVHRDLACRNCLIKKDLTVKIGDFGMSRNLYSRDYYRINGQAVLPVRWMSPEALIYGKFSVEGDVWSFGVVMWEIFSFALQPYYGISNEDVTEYIRKGRTLRRPDYCPMDIFKVMQECWNMEPNERPTFDELHKLLNELHELASVSDDGKDETMSIDSDMPSDAFYSDGMSIDDDLA